MFPSWFMLMWQESDKCQKLYVDAMHMVPRYVTMMQHLLRSTEHSELDKFYL